MSLSIIKEFKEFAMRGNVVDLAVGVIIGGAFGKVTTSLVGDVLMPGIGMLMGGVDFSQFEIVLKEAVLDKPAVTIKYGLFLNTIIDFLIVAFAVFLLIKGINSLKRQPQPAVEKPAAPPAPTQQELLLMQIRDILKAK